MDVCRFYPLYPPPLGTCLDLTADAALQLQQLPDLLLLPSDLAPFAKHVLAAAASEAGGTYQPAATPGAEGRSLWYNSGVGGCLCGWQCRVVVGLQSGAATGGMH